MDMFWSLWLGKQYKKLLTDNQTPITPLSRPKTGAVHLTLERFSRTGPRGRGREWATLGVHPLSWLLSNNRLEKVPFVSVLHTSSNRLLLSNQDKGCTPSVAHSLPLPLGPALLNLWIVSQGMIWDNLNCIVKQTDALFNCSSTTKINGDLNCKKSVHVANPPHLIRLFMTCSHTFRLK